MTAPTPNSTSHRPAVSGRAGTGPRGEGDGAGKNSEPELPRAMTLFYSRRAAVVCVVVWLVLGAWFAPAAYNFAHQIRGTLSGVSDSPAAMVQQSLARNFSKALAFPTAVVWDARSLPPDMGDAYWEQIKQQLESVPGLLPGGVRDASRFIPDWPDPRWKLAFLEIDTPDFRGAEQFLPEVRKFIKEKVRFEATELSAIAVPGSGAPKKAGDLQPGPHPVPGGPGFPPILVTGGPAMFHDLNTESTEALRRAEMLAMPVAFVILLIIFRGIVASLLPIFVAGVAVVVTLGLLSLTADYMAITFFVPNLVSMIGLGVGIDYSLLYLARFRRERELHQTTHEALKLCQERAGHTIMVSAAMVVAGFAALCIIPLNFFLSIALAGSLVVVLTAASSLTLQPALILLLGPALEWGQIRRADSPLAAACQDGWRRLARLVIARPIFFSVTGSIILLLLASPVLHLKNAALQGNTLPPNAEARRGYDSIAAMLGPGWVMPTIILVQHPNAEWTGDPDSARRERELAARLRTLPNTAHVVVMRDPSDPPAARRTKAALMEGNDDRSQSLIFLLPKADPHSNISRDWLVEAQKELTAQEAANPGHEKFILGGIPATTFYMDKMIADAIPRVIGMTLITTFVFLMVMIKSILVPLKAIIMNALCVLAAYGIQVLWFQEGYGAWVDPTFIPIDGINTIVMIICFCALFGLSMDYEVFILSAIRESWLDQKDMSIAIEEGVLRTAGVVTSAAAIMVSVFLCFAFVSVVETRQLGIGLSFAVLLDATLIRIILVPATMALMGKWNWWLPWRPMPLSDSK
ncbi:hypothetical protein DB346_05990 [Verrucomicrobia bacterium LW23]|nr:hypothetical protein DB346_05990 [Verrucomicrobia bacterium LW23]